MFAWLEYIMESQRKAEGFGEKRMELEYQDWQRKQATTLAVV